MSNRNQARKEARAQRRLEASLREPEAPPAPAAVEPEPLPDVVEAPVELPAPEPPPEPTTGTARAKKAARQADRAVKVGDLKRELAEKEAEARSLVDVYAERVEEVKAVLLAPRDNGEPATRSTVINRALFGPSEMLDALGDAFEQALDELDASSIDRGTRVWIVSHMTSTRTGAFDSKVLGAYASQNVAQSVAMERMMEIVTHYVGGSTERKALDKALEEGDWREARMLFTGCVANCHVIDAVAYKVRT